MHVGNQIVSGTTLQTNMAATRTVIVEVKYRYINSKNVVIHSENCKVEIPLDITAQQLSKKICRMTGIYDASKKRGFTDCSTEMFYVDYIEPGQPKKAPLVLRTDDQLSMFFKSDSKSILLRVIQRIVQFEKGSVNILMEKLKSLARSNCLVCLLSHQLHLIVKAQTMEYLKNLHKQLFQVTPENVKKSSVEEAVKRVSKWAAADYTHPASYYKLPSTSAVTLPKISIPKPAVLQVLTRNEEP